MNLNKIANQQTTTAREKKTVVLFTLYISVEV